MNETDIKKATISAKNIKVSSILKQTAIIIILAWMAFFLILHFSPLDLPRRTDSIILLAVVAVVAALEIIDSVYTGKYCRCPYCGCKWSFLKRMKDKKNPFDLFNKCEDYTCVKCDSHIHVE
jgi:predicted RNA-binding Zn ribbon-like protein